MNSQNDEQEDAQIDTAPTPAVRETTTAVVPVSAKKTDAEGESQALVPAAKELVPLDEIESIQSWAMQSHTWKMLNVLLEQLTPAQLQVCIGDDNEFTIFEDIAEILKLALWRPYDGPLYLKPDKELVNSAMTQVRSYIMTNVLPYLVNKSMVFLTPKYSLIYLQLVDRVRAIDDHLKNFC